MGGFAICKTKKDSKISSIDGCHINLWVLPVLRVTPRFFYDVGIILQVADDAPDEKLHLFLPFDCPTPSDLGSKFNDENLSLIFGEEAAKSGDLITLSNRQYKLLSLKSLITAVKDVERKRDFSVWEIKLPHLSKGTVYYLRLRCEPKDLGRVWQRKASGLLTNGYLFDLRFADDRDWVSAPMEPAHELSLDINKLQVFIISQASFQNRAVSPALRYIRTLEEGRQWRSYLGGRRPSYNDRQKFLIYYWKIGAWPKPGTDEKVIEGSPVNWKEPARLFMDQSRDFGYFPLPNYIRLVFLFLLILLLVPYQDVRGWASASIQKLWADHTQQVTFTLAGISGLFLIGYAKGRAAYKSVKDALPVAEKVLRRIEKAVYGGDD